MMHPNPQDDSPPVWAIFGDLMAGMVGVFVMLLIWTLSFQVDLAASLQTEVEKREKEQTRREQLEYALAAPLAEGRITLVDGRIGISGNILFALNSKELSEEGATLIGDLSAPLKRWLNEHDQLLMVSGFTDDLAIHEDNYQFDDNWDLSAQRALEVTRTLVSGGIQANQVFAAAFGEHHPIQPNLDQTARSKNRRGEIAPGPRASRTPEERP